MNSEGEQPTHSYFPVAILNTKRKEDKIIEVIRSFMIDRIQSILIEYETT